MSTSLALSIYVLLILLMQLVNGVQFFIIIFFILSAPAPAVFGTVIVAFASIYSWL